MLIQRQMQDTMLSLQGELSAGRLSRQEALDQAWADAINLIKQIGGNASYLTFSASKVPVDAAHGQIAAGMCIDFYGRSQAEWANRLKGEMLMLFQTPPAASTVSADPVGILRGAPNPELARIFVDFLLSERGQRLWNYRAGTPGGPQKYTLHRLPVRRDLYTDQDRLYMSAPDDPFAGCAFEYQGLDRPLFDDEDLIQSRSSIVNGSCAKLGGLFALPAVRKKFQRPWRIQPAPVCASGGRHCQCLAHGRAGHTTREWAGFSGSVPGRLPVWRRTRQRDAESCEHRYFFNNERHESFYIGANRIGAADEEPGNHVVCDCTLLLRGTLIRHGLLLILHFTSSCFFHKSIIRYFRFGDFVFSLEHWLSGTLLLAAQDF